MELSVWTAVKLPRRLEEAEKMKTKEKQKKKKKKKKKEKRKCAGIASTKEARKTRSSPRVRAKAAKSGSICPACVGGRG